MTTPTPRQRLEALCRRQFDWLAAQDMSRQLVADLLAELTAAVAELERLAARRAAELEMQNRKGKTR